MSYVLTEKGEAAIAREAARRPTDLPKLTLRKCECGSKSCDYHGFNVGSFYQGTGFHKKDAEEVARRCNTYPDLLAALKKWEEFMRANYEPADISWWAETEAAIVQAEGRS